LKGNDRLKVKHLLEACDKFGFLCYLGRLERKVSGEFYNYHGGWEDAYTCYKAGDMPKMHHLIKVDEESLMLKLVVQLDGSVVIRDIPLENHSIVQSDAFDIEADRKEWPNTLMASTIWAEQSWYRTVS
jgi:hypothetical protein